ncbi:MAG: class II fructose-bisphosphate aldolase [Eubacteriaceae bacterium]|nr:class II fructose-bisphosphate aldolase [Eubacteriaceae bacterium]
MALVTMKKLLDDAVKRGGAFGAFSVGNMEMVKGAVKAAEKTKTGIVLQIAEVRLKHSPLDLMGPMMVQAAKDSKVNIAVHLDHGQTMPVIKQALELGFTSVMYDGSTMPFRGNIAKTKDVVALAGKYGATVEGELGLVGGSEDGSEDHGIKCTDPMDALQFVNRTGVDALAVAIGNAHGHYTAAPKLAFHVLSEIAAKTNTPLVLHGGSGISDEDFQKAIRLGIRKVNIATASFTALTEKVEEYMGKGTSHNYFDMNEAMVEGVYENVKRHIEVFNGAVKGEK